MDLHGVDCSALVIYFNEKFGEIAQLFEIFKQKILINLNSSQNKSKCSKNGYNRNTNTKFNLKIAPIVIMKLFSLVICF